MVDIYKMIVGDSMFHVKLAAGLLSIIAAGLIGFAIWDRIPEVDADPKNAPVMAGRMAETETLPLSRDVANPAGIAFMQDSGTYLVSTDDRVFIELSSDFSSIISSLTISNNPYAIGDTEGVAYLGDGRAAVVGENGAVVVLERAGANWRETERFPIAGFKLGTQLGSAAYDPATGTVYTAQKKGKKLLYRIDLESGAANVVQMTLDPQLKELPGRNWQEFTIAGLLFHKQRLYAISEAFTSILVINPEGVVEDIIGLSGANESSGVTIRDDLITLIGDAESYLPDPPIYIVEKSASDR